jgi:hypothetical protein
MWPRPTLSLLSLQWPHASMPPFLPQSPASPVLCQRPATLIFTRRTVTIPLHPIPSTKHLPCRTCPDQCPFLAPLCSRPSLTMPHVLSARNSIGAVPRPVALGVPLATTAPVAVRTLLNHPIAPMCRCVPVPATASRCAAHRSDAWGRAAHRQLCAACHRFYAAAACHACTA